MAGDISKWDERRLAQFVQNIVSRHNQEAKRGMHVDELAAHKNVQFGALGELDTYLDRPALGTLAINSIPIQTSATAPSMYNVMGYGVTGDGVTDDAPAIQNLVDLVVLSGGGTIYFPKGTYLLGTTIIVYGNNPISFVGNGSAVLILSASFTRASPPSFRSGTGGVLQLQAHFFIGNLFSPGFATDHMTFDGLILDGNKANLTPDVWANATIWGAKATNLTIRNCTAQNVNSGGSSANAAFVLTGASDQAICADNRVVSVNGGGFFTQGARANVTGNNFYSVGDCAITFNGTGANNGTATGNTITLCNPQAAFACEAGAYNWNITGNTIKDCAKALDINDATYVGGAIGGGVFSNNLIYNLNNTGGGLSASVGIHVRGSQVRGVNITDNVFQGITVVGTVDSAIYIANSTEGLTIQGNTFETIAQAAPAMIIVNTSTTQTRLVIRDNIFRSTSATTKLSKGIWFEASSTITNSQIQRNLFENITNYAIHFDTSVTFTGTLENNLSLNGSVGQLYQGSPWGTFAPPIPHILHNTFGRSVINAGAAPTTGTWQKGDIAWNNSPPAAGTVGWFCTTAGTPGTWTGLTIP